VFVEDGLKISASVIGGDNDIAVNFRIKLRAAGGHGVDFQTLKPQGLADRELRSGRDD